MKRDLAKGIGMILLAALLTCLGQLAWKLAAEADSLLLLLPGFALYGGGALLMILAITIVYTSVKELITKKAEKA